MDGSSTPRLTHRMVITFLIYILLFALMPILASGQMDWWQGWVYAILTILTALLSRLVVAARHPDLLAERGRMNKSQDAPTWDKRLAPFVGLVGPLTSLFVCGLDKRFSWSPPFPMWVVLSTLIIGTIASLFASWALVENRFFSGVVRIQSERDQHVVTSGPYRLVRHPGYVGAGLNFLTTPIFLGSLWGLIPSLSTVVLLVYRTHLEDGLLQTELSGYREYTERTRYRLIPGIW